MGSQVKTFVCNLKKYWNTPAPGRFVPFREVAAYGVGGMGVHFATTLASAIGLSASNFLVGSALGIDPVHLQTMNIIASVFGFGVTALRSYLFDNSRSKYGKFRPWLKWMGLPTVLSSILFVWMPYEQMTYNEKVITVEICYLLINCFNPFFTEAFNLLIQVMSPNTEERTDIMSGAQIVFSFAPTITNLVIPALAPITGGLNNIRTYRIIYPIFTLLGLALTYFIYSKTKERIIYSKSETRSIRFSDALRSASKNKYFWLTNIATWIGFLESAYLTILQWTFVYAIPEKQGWLGVANTVIGNGALWAMLIAPFLIRRFGKRNLLIWCNVANIFLLAALYFSYQNIWFVMIICYINNFINVFGNIYNPGIQADMKDYQQWKTGERIDGMFGVLGIIGTVIGFGTGYVLPALYRMCGLNTDYNVLYDATIRNNIFRMLIISSIIGAVLNCIPFLFYDLTEDKHYGMIKVIKLRAVLDDYRTGTVDNEELKECADIIQTAKKLSSERKQPLPNRLHLRKPKKGAPEAEVEKYIYEIRENKKLRKEIKIQNREVAASAVISQELSKFSTERYKAKLVEAKYIESLGINGILNMDVSHFDEKIKNTDRKSKEGKEIRSDLKELKRCVKSAQRLAKKYYHEQIIKPNERTMENALQMQTGSLIKTVKRKMAISSVLKEKSIYRRCALPYTQAVAIINQAKNYEDIDSFLEFCSSTKTSMAENV